MRTLRWIVLLTLLLTAPASAGTLTATVDAVASGSLPDHCVLARFTSPRPLDLSPRDVCTFSRGGTTLGNGVVLLATDDVAVLYLLFGRPLHQGDGMQLAERQGWVLEDAFLLRLGDFYAQVGAMGDAGAQKPLWKGLHYYARSDFAPPLLHLWAASLDGQTVRGVDEEGLWRTLPLAHPDLFIARSDKASQRVRRAPRGVEMDLVLGRADGRQVVVAGVARPLLRLESLLPRLLPRVPLSFGERVALPPVPPDLKPASTLRQLRGCRVATLDLLQGRATVRTFNGEQVRVNLPDPLLDAATGKPVRHESLVSMPQLDLVCYSDGRACTALALGEPSVPAEVAPPVLGEVEAPLGADYYRLALKHRSGLRPRDVVHVWRGNARLGSGIVFTTGAHPLLFAQAGTPPLQPGDTMTFARRADGAYVDADGFTDLVQCKAVRQTTDPRRWFDLRGYANDKPPVVPDLYKDGPYARERPEIRKSGEEARP